MDAQSPRLPILVVLTLLTSIGIKGPVAGRDVIGQVFGSVHYSTGRSSYPPFIWYLNYLLYSNASFGV
jgi:hypothetical protein